MVPLSHFIHYWIKMYIALAITTRYKRGQLKPTPEKAKSKATSESGSKFDMELISRVSESGNNTTKNFASSLLRISGMAGLFSRVPGGFWVCLCLLCLFSQGWRGLLFPE